MKGVAGFLGFDPIHQLTHALESVLDRVRKDRLAMSAELVDGLLAATDTLRNLIEHAMSRGMPIDQPLQRLQVRLAPASNDAELRMSRVGPPDPSVPGACNAAAGGADFAQQQQQQQQRTRNRRLAGRRVGLPGRASTMRRGWPHCASTRE